MIDNKESVNSSVLTSAYILLLHVWGLAGLNASLTFHQEKVMRQGTGACLRRGGGSCLQSRASCPLPAPTGACKGQDRHAGAGRDHSALLLWGFAVRWLPETTQYLLELGGNNFKGFKFRTVFFIQYNTVKPKTVKLNLLDESKDISSPEFFFSLSLLF